MVQPTLPSAEALKELPTASPSCHDMNDPNSGMQRDGKAVWRSRASKAGWHPKSEITKIKMLQRDDFSHCKATDSCCMDLVFRNFVFFVNTAFYVFKFQQFTHLSIPGTYTLGVRRTRNQTDRSVLFSRLCNQVKITLVTIKKDWKIIMDV